MLKTLRMGKRLAFVVLVGTLGLCYVQQITAYNRKTYTIAELTIKRDHLKSQVQDLIIEEAKERSLWSARKAAQKIGMVPTTSVTYVSPK